ncbi:NAD(P)(+)--arginine ADP-ribosyltransferase 2-like [Chamaea fasciata]|uniref:NAD(P)(+)--arginine ADP-ribosyltransferase 2-like n=1 Tax=Chamaea fasciata TaxID=190680 RepID=UPI003369D659
MAALAHTLALLAMVMATVAIEVTPRQYLSGTGCRRDMTQFLSALNRSEFQQNPLFARVWVKATAEWQGRGAPESPLPPEQAIAVIAYTMKDMYQEFNAAVHVAGRSRQEYREKFHFKTLHFLLNQAVTLLGADQNVECQYFLQKVCGIQFEAKRGDTIRFGELASMSINKTTGNCSGKETLFRVYTCQGVNISFFSDNLLNWGVLIPPFETFEVTQVTEAGDKAVIQLRSTTTYSINDCEDLEGGSISVAPFHLGGLLLATTALAVATGIL